MNDPLHAFATENWYGPDAGSLKAFIASVPDAADPADWPLATEILRDVLVYDGAAVRAMDAQGRRTLMAEWARAFLTGPGIIVIRGAFADLAVVDRATALFERLIEAERASGAGGGDHFAKPGANDRVWNALQKHCQADPEGYALYYANICLATAATAWLGPHYQFTAQVNRVNPGGAAQAPHRDYHLGFMTPREAARWPAHAHLLSPALTLQGAVAHVDMPVETGPTLFLPWSQRFAPGYIAFNRPEFQDHFARHHVQLPLARGDAVFFNPALMHGAGTNRTTGTRRMANLLQIGSAFGRSIETVDRAAMCKALFAPLRALIAANRLDADEVAALIAATAEGYAYPTNLDRDPPAPGRLAPESQADILARALADGRAPESLAAEIDAWEARRRA